MDSQTVFAALRDALAELYSGEQDSHVVVADAGLDASQITFSNRAQTNWHNILAEALRQNRLDPCYRWYSPPPIATTLHYKQPMVTTAI